MKKIKKILLKIFGELRKVYDNLFGEMIDADGYYECHAFFKPSNKIVEIGIEGDKNGPYFGARSFYKEIENNYDTLVEIIHPKIQEKLSSWNPDIKIDNFKDEFEPEYLFVPDISNNEKWNITFNTIHDSHLLSVAMNKFKVETIRIEG